jgi:hypothetical protein
MIRKMLLVAAVTAAAALSMVYLPGTAGAAPTAVPGTLSPSPGVTEIPNTGPPVTWIPAGCATGSFDPVAVDQGHYLLPAHITLCVPYKAKYTYTLVLFTPDWDVPLATRMRLRPYAESGPALVTADIMLSSPEPVIGMCLMRTVNDRVACVRVDTTAAGVVTSTPIPFTDPLVAKQVYYDDQWLPETTDPVCATCVAFR